MNELGGCFYQAVTAAVGFVVFVACWFYCIAEYGFLLGGGLGWIPSAIAAGLAALLWPLAVVGAIALWIWIEKNGAA